MEGPQIVGPNEKLHGSIGWVTRPKPWNGPQIVGPNGKTKCFHRETRPKPWNGPQIVGPNGKTKWFHKGNEAKTMERSSNCGTKWKN